MKAKTEGGFVIVRCRDAGVHCGTLKSVDGRAVELENARRIWRWRGANTLNELAASGADMDAHTRISEPVEEIALLESCEVIKCTDVAKRNLEESRWLD